MTWFLLVLIETFVIAGTPGVEVKPVVVAQFADPYDCDVQRASLTGYTLEGRYLVCVPAKAPENKLVVPYDTFSGGVTLP